MFLAVVFDTRRVVFNGFDKLYGVNLPDILIGADKSVYCSVIPSYRRAVFVLYFEIQNVSSDIRLHTARNVDVIVVFRHQVAV